MLPKNLRLSKKKDFDRVFKKGRSSFNSLTGVKVIENTLELSRFGFIVSGKVSKKAVDRNLVKRRMREIVRKNLKQIKPGYDGVVIAQREAKNANFTELKVSLQQNLAKLKVFK